MCAPVIVLLNKPLVESLFLTCFHGFQTFLLLLSRYFSMFSKDCPKLLFK